MGSSLELLLFSLLSLRNHLADGGIANMQLICDFIKGMSANQIADVGENAISFELVGTDLETQEACWDDLFPHCKRICGCENGKVRIRRLNPETTQCKPMVLFLLGPAS